MQPGRHAPRRGDHQARPRQGELPRGAGRSARRVRGQGFTALSADRHAKLHRPDRIAFPDLLQVRRRRAHHPAARPIGRRSHRGGARQPDRGDHRGVRGRVADGALPRRRADRRVGAHRGFGASRCPGLLLSGAPGVQRHRHRHPRIAGHRHPWLPVPAGTPAAGGLYAAGRRPRHAGLRRQRAVAGRGGQDHVGPLRRQGQPGPGVLRDHQARRDGSCVGPFFVLLWGIQRELRQLWESQLAPRPRRRRTDRGAVVPAGQAAAPGVRRGGGRHLRHRQAEPRRNRRHALGQDRAACPETLDYAGAAAADRHSGARQSR